MKYTKYKLTPEKRFKCQACGKHVKRQKTFWQTMSRFNRGLSGAVKSPKEIYESLNSQADQWHKDTVLCATCEGKT